MKSKFFIGIPFITIFANQFFNDKAIQLLSIVSIAVANGVGRNTKYTSQTLSV